jgi:cytochrome c oxidase subunit II
MLLNRRIGKLVWLLLGYFLVGCTGAPAIILPASGSAEAINELLWIVFGVSLIAFLLIEGMLFFVVFKFRSKNDHTGSSGLPNQIEGNQPIEVAWTVLPAIGLLIIFIISVGTLQTIVNRPAPDSENPGVINVKAIGHQWWWEFQYPDLKIITASEMHVPVNALVYVQVDSADVIHSFWVPQMGGKTDVIPGHTNLTWFQATELGTFVGECSEFCGDQHANMRMDLVVETPEQYQAWVGLQRSTPSMQLSGEEAEGEELFLEGACSSCHTINGTEAAGLSGPNLSHFGSRKSIGGKVFENTPENLAMWLKDPSMVKMGVLMPNLGLSTEQINALVAFLDNLK